MAIKVPGKINVKMMYLSMGLPLKCQGARGGSVYSLFHFTTSSSKPRQPRQTNLRPPPHSPLGIVREAEEVAQDLELRNAGGVSFHLLHSQPAKGSEPLFQHLRSSKSCATSSASWKRAGRVETSTTSPIKSQLALGNRVRQVDICLGLVCMEEFQRLFHAYGSCILPVDCCDLPPEFKNEVRPLNSGMIWPNLKTAANLCSSPDFVLDFAIVRCVPSTFGYYILRQDDCLGHPELQWRLPRIIRIGDGFPAMTGSLGKPVLRRCGPKLQQLQLVQEMAVGQTCLVVRNWALVMVVSPRKMAMEYLLEFLHGQVRRSEV